MEANKRQKERSVAVGRPLKESVIRVFSHVRIVRVGCSAPTIDFLGQATANANADATRPIHSLTHPLSCFLANVNKDRGSIGRPRPVNESTNESAM